MTPIDRSIILDEAKRYTDSQRLGYTRREQIFSAQLTDGGLVVETAPFSIEVDEGSLVASGSTSSVKYSLVK